LTGTNGAAIPAVVAAFGESVLTRDQALDRVQMRHRVFSDPSARHRLESIIHPMVGAEVQRQAEFAQCQGHRCIVFDIPLLVESGSGWRPRLDRLLVIDCGEEVQIQRVMARSGLQRVEVERIIASQTDRKSRLSAADAVIFNDGIGLEGLADQLAILAPSFGL
jgi:dephospho-CoA kinase